MISDVMWVSGRRWVEWRGETCALPNRTDRVRVPVRIANGVELGYLRQTKMNNFNQKPRHNSKSELEMNEWLMLMLLLMVYCARPARDQRFPRLRVIWIFMYPFSLCIFSIPYELTDDVCSLQSEDLIIINLIFLLNKWKKLTNKALEQQQHPKKQKSHKQMNNTHDEVIKRCGPPAISCSLIIITLTTSCLAGRADLIFHSSTANSIRL